MDGSSAWIFFGLDIRIYHALRRMASHVQYSDFIRLLIEGFFVRKLLQNLG